jgi:simple sugar transport system permease protein
LLLAVATISFRADQIVATIALNIIALGLTSFFLRMAFGTSGQTTVKVASMANWPVPLLVDIPIVGPVLFNHPPLTYLAYLLVPATAVLLYRTKWGLNIRAVGEAPKAAHVVGISPWKTQYLAVCFSGGLAGLGGAVLSLQQVGFFTEHMTQGRGFIALAAVIFGRWDPKVTFGACLLFGAAEALQLRVQAFGLPISSHVVLMLPYIIALLALMGLGSRARHPTSINRPYVASGN